MIEFTKGNWVDYPNTTTPITAAELNRMEQGIEAACNGVNSLPSVTDVKTLICNVLLWAIDGLHNDYTHTVISEPVETGEDITMSLIFDFSLYNADTDGLLVTVNGVLMNPSAYTVSVEDNASRVRFGTSAALKIGQTVDLHIYKKPIAATGTAFGEAIGMADGYSTTAVSGIAEEEEEEES